MRHQQFELSLQRAAAGASGFVAPSLKDQHSAFPSGGKPTLRNLSGTLRRYSPAAPLPTGSPGGRYQLLPPKRFC